MKINSIFTGLFAILVAAFTVLATVGYAQQRMSGQHGEIGYLPGGDGLDSLGTEAGFMRLFRMAEELDLSEEQRAAIWKLVDDARPALRDNLFTLMDSRKELRNLLVGDKAVEDRKLRAITKIQGDAIAELSYLRIKLQSDIRGILTAEQLTKVREFRDQGRRLRRDRVSDRREKLERYRASQQSGEDQEERAQ